MKTIIIIICLLPLLAYALSRLYLYLTRFNEQKCKCCPFSSDCGPVQKVSCSTTPRQPEKKFF